MQLPPKNYDAMVKRANPPSPVVKDCLWAFFVGGAICLLGEALRQFYLSLMDNLSHVTTATPTPTPTAKPISRFWMGKASDSAVTALSDT